MCAAAKRHFLNPVYPRLLRALLAAAHLIMRADFVRHLFANPLLRPWLPRQP